ncbi:hypothetical protein PPIS_a4379 [Pseudoalteromonas piscicida]|uniref:Uncharacterized protein n=1 Tax=Pseudoalteromonas piscicida TaxID=43662 RepID=A0ABM6NJ75_PSEO7|nr:hypothetical protein PPIS_a4379 [Pseudoalteromonas piscicida]
MIVPEWCSKLVLFRFCQMVSELVSVNIESRQKINLSN